MVQYSCISMHFMRWIIVICIVCFASLCLGSSIDKPQIELGKGRNPKVQLNKDFEILDQAHDPSHVNVVVIDGKVNNERVSTSSHAIETIYSIRKGKKQFTKTKILKQSHASKKAKLKVKRLSWWKTLRMFAISLFDPTCDGIVEIEVKGSLVSRYVRIVGSCLLTLINPQ